MQVETSKIAVAIIMQYLCLKNYVRVFFTKHKCILETETLIELVITRRIIYY